MFPCLLRVKEAAPSSGRKGHLCNVTRSIFFFVHFIPSLQSSFPAFFSLFSYITGFVSRYSVPVADTYRNWMAALAADSKKRSSPNQPASEKNKTAPCSSKIYAADDADDLRKGWHASRTEKKLSLAKDQGVSYKPKPAVDFPASIPNFIQWLLRHVPNESEIGASTCISTPTIFTSEVKTTKQRTKWNILFFSFNNFFF